ncbi:hypothetical protein BHE74_00046269 [Ensete ventricosum]|nr:hypothetical protein BHE74_00046269 [Ensete ventricosum]
MPSKQKTTPWSAAPQGMSVAAEDSTVAGNRGGSRRLATTECSHRMEGVCDTIGLSEMKGTMTAAVEDAVDAATEAVVADRQRGKREIIYPCIPDPDGEDEGG